MMQGKLWHLQPTSTAPNGTLRIHLAGELALLAGGRSPGPSPLCTHEAASHVPALYVPVRQPVVFIVQDVQHCLGGSSPTSFQDACFALEVEPPSLTGPPNKLTEAEHWLICISAVGEMQLPDTPFCWHPFSRQPFLLRHSPWAYHCGCACGSPGSWRWDNSSCTVGRGRPAHWGRPP